jgi:AraC-like DNA-binding protein
MESADPGKSSLLHYDFGGCTVNNTCQYHSTSEACKAYTETFPLPCGILLYIANIYTRIPISVTCTNIKGSVGFGFCVEGNMYIKDFNNKEDIIIDSGKMAIFSSPDYDSCTEVIQQGQTTRISVSITRDNISILNDMYNETGKFCNLLLSRDIFLNINDVSFDLQSIIIQIINCNFIGPIRKMYIDAKSVELFSHCIYKYINKNNIKYTNHCISNKDIENIHHAAYILTHDLDNIPTLYDLARSVGMSRGKLHQIFPKVYGMTPFEYLRVHRLEKAKEMLLFNHVNVTEAAFSAGYSSLSHFTKAFTRQFNCHPSECRSHG